MLNRLGKYIEVFKKAFRRLTLNDPLRMAGATAFFTTFALPPILVILIQFLRLVLDPDFIRSQLFGSLTKTLGQASVDQITGVLAGLKNMAQNWYVTAGGFIFLLFVSTTLFKVIKDSLNQLWKVKTNRKKKILNKMRTRLQAILIIFIAGILFALGIFAEGVQAYIGEYISGISTILGFYFNQVVNFILSLLVITIWFSMVFRYLPDARPEWRVALAGGFVTALLFSLGKFLLRRMLNLSNIDSLYGTSASIVLLLLFVFYSSLILYFGGCFTKEWSKYINRPIQPLPHASNYKLVEAEA